MPHDYERDGAAIYRQSFATIRAEADLARFDADEEPVVVRMIHAAGLVGLEHGLCSPGGDTVPLPRLGRRGPSPRSASPAPPRPQPREAAGPRWRRHLPEEQHRRFGLTSGERGPRKRGPRET